MDTRNRRRAATLLAAATLMLLPATAAVADEEPSDGPQICFDLRLSLFGNDVDEAFCLPS